MYGNGMPLTIEDATELFTLRAKHQVGIIAICQVDVGRQDAIRGYAVLNDLREVIQVLSCGNFHHVFCRPQASCRCQ